MPDLRADPAFRMAVDGARHAIEGLATVHGVPDAVALYERARNVNNLIGHARSIVPYAVLLSRVFPGLLISVRARTDLRARMTAQSAEARDPWLWPQVKNASVLLASARGRDVIAEEVGSGTPQSVADVAQTYLSQAYGGGQTTGGAGDTVVKRTLKLLAHLQYE